MIRYGIIGAGSIARRFARDIKLANDSELVAVSSRSIEKSKDFCNEFDISNSFGNYKDMVMSDLIDAVYVATPHSFHMEHSILAMKHQKHVICEKPISVNSLELEKMIKVAKQQKVLLMEAMWTRFLPGTNYVKKHIDSGDYGDIQHMDFSFGFEMDEEYPGDGRLLNPQLAGGSILDLMVYPVSVMRFLSKKEISEISVSSDINSDGIDLDTSVDVVFNDETTATLRSSIAQDLDPIGTIILENGRITMKKFYHCSEMMFNADKVSTPCLGEGFVHQIESFSKSILEGKLENDVMTYNESRDVMQILDLIRDKVGIIYPTEIK